MVWCVYGHHDATKQATIRCNVGHMLTPVPHPRPIPSPPQPRSSLVTTARALPLLLSCTPARPLSFLRGSYFGATLSPVASSLRPHLLYCDSGPAGSRILVQKTSCRNAKNLITHSQQPDRPSCRCYFRRGRVHPARVGRGQRCCSLRSGGGGGWGGGRDGSHSRGHHDLYAGCRLRASAHAPSRRTGVTLIGDVDSVFMGGNGGDAVVFCE